MATQWYYQSDELTVGPVSFGGLVELARGGVIGPEDPVRSDWDEEWQAAECVPGLFYMARRAPPAAPAEAPEPEADQAETAPVSAVTVARPAEAAPQPHWLARLVDFRSRLEAQERSAGKKELRSAAPARNGSDVLTNGTGEADSSRDDDAGAPSGVSGAVAAALQDVENRRGGGNGWRKLRSVSTAATAVWRSPVLRYGVRLGAAAGCAAVAAWLVESWSAQEALRFPSREAEPAMSFPLVGNCGATTYRVLVLDLVAGVAGGVYAVLGWVGSQLSSPG